jgi:hypothetical protein
MTKAVSCVASHDLLRRERTVIRPFSIESFCRTDFLLDFLAELDTRSIKRKEGLKIRECPGIKCA